MKFSSVIYCAFFLAVVLMLGIGSGSQPCNPNNCGDDADCPQYFKGICGSYKGKYTMFAGDCYMENYNCRNCKEFVTVPDALCQKAGM